VSTLQELRFALRLFRRAPLPAVLVISSVGLTVGATAVVFTAIKQVLIRPLPYARPGELVQIRSDYPRLEQQSAGDWVFWNDTQELARRTRTLQSIGVYRNAIFDLAGGPGAVPEALYGLLATASLFPTLGVSPMLGRDFSPAEQLTARNTEMILSYGLWVRRFNSDPGVVGRSVVVNGHACLILGVMPPEFNFPLRRAAAHTPSPYVEFWAPLSSHPAGQEGLGAVARLRPGVSLDQARQDLAGISDALGRQFPALNRDRVLHLNLVRDRTVGLARNGLLLLLGAAVLFMLIGCANVANLLLARSLTRQREIDIRFALGATPLQVARQLLTESCLLASFGGVAGYLVAAASWKVLPSLAPVAIPRLAGARADSTIFGFALALALLNGILFGSAPALRLFRGRVSPLGALGVRVAGAQNRDRARSALAIAEIALSVVLVVIGAQLFANFVRLIATDPGFEAGRVLASVVLPAPERYPRPEQRALFYRRILDAVRAIPGVESAGTVDALPFSGENHGGSVRSNTGTALLAEIDVAGGEYLETMGVHLLEGRWFRDGDMDESADAAIVNQWLAVRLFPSGDAVGRRICVFCTPENPNNWKRVVGVVSSMHHSALDQTVNGNVYLAAGAMRTSVFIVVRAGRPAGELEKAIRRTIAAIDPGQPVFLSASMTSLIADSVADRRFIALLLSITAFLALVLSAAGVYGVISYGVSSRTQEFGVRVAVGATPSHILALVSRQGAAAIAAGLATGTGGALAAMRGLGAFVPGLRSPNSAAIWIAAAVVALSAAVACWVPAWRAAKTDPLVALRHE
jgi:putative ABC transport system permease protein